MKTITQLEKQVALLSREQARQHEELINLTFALSCSIEAQRRHAHRIPAKWHTASFPVAVRRAA